MTPTNLYAIREKGTNYIYGKKKFYESKAQAIAYGVGKRLYSLNPSNYEILIYELKEVI